MLHIRIERAKWQQTEFFVWDALKTDPTKQRQIGERNPIFAAPKTKEEMMLKSQKSTMSGLIRSFYLR